MVPRPLTAAGVQHVADVLGVAGAPTRTSFGYQVQGGQAALTFITSGGTVQVSYVLGGPQAIGGFGGSAVGGIGSTTAVGHTPPAAGNVASPPVPLAPNTAPLTRVRSGVTPVLPMMPTIAKPVDVPSGHDALTFARTLLDRLGVLNAQHWATEVSDASGVAVACAVGMKCPFIQPQVTARTVTFHLLLSGVQVGGADWSVTVGSHRRVESLNGEWAVPEIVGSYPIRSTAAVFNDLQHGRARYVNPVPMMQIAGLTPPGASGIASPSALPAIHVQVTGVSLGFERWNAFDHGQSIVDLVPTYRFHTRLSHLGGYDIELLALEPTAIQFMNPTPARPAVPVDRPAPSLLPVPAPLPASPPPR